MRMFVSQFKRKNSFTIVELLIAVGILALLTAVSVTFINPIEYFKQSRDTQRVSDLNKLNVAISKIKYSNQKISQAFLGSPNIIYTSLPDSLSDCGNYNLATLPTGWTYHCVEESVSRKTNGTGWIPVNFESIGLDANIVSLPLDPSNNAEGLTYYTYAVDSSGKYEMRAYLESIKERELVSSKDGGVEDNYYEVGMSFALLNPQEPPAVVVSALNSLVSASPSQVLANNSDQITVTVTAKDSLDAPVAGSTVVISVTGTGNTITQPATVTDENGVATGTVKSSVGEVKTISASIDGVSILQTAEVTFTSVSASNSLVSASPTQASANNSDLITITITAKDSLDNPFPGATVTVSVTGTGNTIVQPASVTNSSGIATSTVKSSIGESKTISASIDGVSITQTAIVNFSPIYTTGGWTTDSTGGATQSWGNAITEVDGYIYVLAGNSQTFQKYNTVTKAWTNLTNIPAAVSAGASIVKVSSNIIYATIGNSATNFYKYTISSNTWSSMAALPGGTWSSALTYPGTGDLIYAFQGTNEKSFWQYSIANNTWSVYSVAQSWGNSIVEVEGVLYVSNGGDTRFYKFEPTLNKWTTLAVLPGATSAGSSMVKASNDVIYATRGGGNTTLYKYVISTNTWSTMATMPGAIYSGSSLAYPGTGDLIYVFQGWNKKSFWQYSIANNSWSIYSVAQNYGNSIVEVEGVLYVLNGGGQNFYKFEPTLNKWTALANITGGVDTGSSMTKVGSDAIYVTRGGANTNFYKYTISTNTWSNMTALPAAVYGGASLAYPGTGDLIYVFQGWNKKSFWQYSIANNTWSVYSVAQNYGNSIVEVEGVLYVLNGGGQNFYKFEPTLNKWTALANITSGISAGAAMVKVDNDTIYATIGNYSAVFYKYTISTNAWTAMTSMPAGVISGCSLAYYPSGGTIFALKGWNSNVLWKYSTSGNSWSVATTTPATVYGGGSATTVGGYMYVLRGNNSTTFWRFSLSDETWSTMTSVPATIQSGGSLTNDGTYVYASRGGNTTDIYKYDPGSNSWSSLAASPLTIGYGSSDDYAKGGIAYSASSSAIYAISGNSTVDYGSIMKYDVATNSWPMAVVAPDLVHGGGALTAFSSSTLYALRGNNTNAFWQYDIPTGTWTVKATTTAAVRGGGSLTNDGTYVYATRGAGTTDYYKYDPATNSWSSLTATPIIMGDGSNEAARGGIAYSASSSAIYVVSGNGTTEYGSIMKYNPSTNSWPMAVVAPDLVYGGGALTAFSSSTLYALKGYNTGTFWQYDIPTGTWTVKATTTALVLSGGSLTSDGTYVYATMGGNTTSFYKYNPTTNEWSSLSATPIGVGYNSRDDYARGGIAYSASSSAIYVVSGNGTANYGSIMKYDPATNSWPMAVVAPDVVYGGASLTALNSTTLYALKGKGTNTFWQYDIPTGTWTVKATTTAIIKSGGSLTNDGTYIYALRGSNTYDAYKYSPSTDSWSTIATTTIAVGYDNTDNYSRGGITFTSSSSAALFATPGSGTSIMKNALSQ